MYVSGKRCNTTHALIILVRLAIGTSDRAGDEAATDNWGIATAALPDLGHGISGLAGVVVVVVGGGNVVVVGGLVVVVGGTVVVGGGDWTVVVVTTVVVVVDVAIAGVVNSTIPGTTLPTATVRSGTRRSHGRENNFTDSMYRVGPLPTARRQQLVKP